MNSQQIRPGRRMHGNGRQDKMEAYVTLEKGSLRIPRSSAGHWRKNSGQNCPFTERGAMSRKEIEAIEVEESEETA